MKLLIDATPLQSEHRLRGVGMYVRRLITEIEALGSVEPIYLASSFGRSLVEEIVPSERIFTLPRPHRPAQVYWLYNELALRTALARVRPDVFLATDFNGLLPNPSGQTIAVLYDLTQLKLMGEARAPQPLTERAPTLSKRLDNLRWHVYYRRKLAQADHLITISHSVKRDAVALLDLADTKIAPIHLGVDLEHFVPRQGAGRFASEPPYILHLGGRNDNKNQARLLEAFAWIAAEQPSWHLYFAGPWQDADHAWLRARSTAFGLSDRVRHIGYVANDDLPSLYSNAVLFAFPSLEEGFGLPVLEAMACKTPVVTSDRSSLPEIAAGAARLVDPLDVAALALTLRELGDTDVRQHLSEAGFVRAQTFGWRQTAVRTLETIADVARRAPRD